MQVIAHRLGVKPGIEYWTVSATFITEKPVGPRDRDWPQLSQGSPPEQNSRPHRTSPRRVSRRESHPPHRRHRARGTRARDRRCPGLGRRPRARQRSHSSSTQVEMTSPPARSSCRYPPSSGRPGRVLTRPGVPAQSPGPSPRPLRRRSGTRARFEDAPTAGGRPPSRSPIRAAIRCRKRRPQPARRAADVARWGGIRALRAPRDRPGCDPSFPGTVAATFLTPGSRSGQAQAPGCRASRDPDRVMSRSNPMRRCWSRTSIDLTVTKRGSIAATHTAAGCTAPAPSPPRAEAS